MVPDADPTAFPADVPRLRQTLGPPACARLLERLRKRLENGRTLTGTILLPAATPAERDHLAALLGDSPARGADFRVDLRRLEACLQRGGVAASLAQAVGALCGPVTDRRAVRLAREQVWGRLFAVARASLGAAPDLPGWLDEFRSKGILRRAAGDDCARAEMLLRDAVAALSRVPVDDVPLARFAAAVLGDSHALDPDRAVAGPVMRALAGRAGLARWDDAETRREAWSAAGVIADDAVRAPTCLKPANRVLAFHRAGILALQ